MRALDDADVLAYHLTLGYHDQSVGVDTQVDRPVGERGRNAVAFDIEMNQTGRRHPFGVLDKTVERSPQRHQAGPLLNVHVGDAARQTPCAISPQRSMQRASSHVLSEGRSEKLGMFCQIWCRASWTFFST